MFIIQRSLTLDLFLEVGADHEPHEESGAEGAAQRDAQRPPPGHLVEAQHWDTHTEGNKDRLRTKGH